MMTLYIVLSSMLIVFNALLLAVVLFFMKDKRDNASRVGFGIMEAVFVMNIILLIGGLLI